MIDPRFNGPPGTGNGGYVCGRVAAWIDGPAQVRLHVPVPLGRALDVSLDPPRVLVRDGPTTVATGSPCALELEVPTAPTLEEARRASAGYAGLSGHPFPTCFVCGTARARSDGLRLFAGPLGDRLVAAAFEPPPDLADGEGLLRPEVAWAALDCPGFFAGLLRRDLVGMLLGEFAVRLSGPLPTGPLVAFAWPLGTEGRKIRCGSALAAPDGRLLGVGRATWILPRAEA